MAFTFYEVFHVQPGKGKVSLVSKFPDIPAYWQEKIYKTAEGPFPNMD